MPKYKHLSITPEDYECIADLMERFNHTNNASLTPPQTVIMAVKRVLSDMGGGKV